jgi:ribosomal protein S12 methylthiotransferase accessory factor
MRILELRKGSAEEAELLEAAAAAHGDWVLAAAPLMSRLWLMRSAWAPGLRYLGGLATAPDVANQSGMPPLSVGGAGLRLEDALAGCLAEAIERTAQIERAGDIVLTAPIDAVRVPDQVSTLIDLVVARDPTAAGRPIDWLQARNATTGADTLLPADWCLRRRKPPTLAIPGAALSTGCAAAATAEEAGSRGLLELIERDAASLWWLGGHPATALVPGSTEAAAAARLSAELRLAEESGRTTRVVNISSDLAIPVMAAIAQDASGTGLAIGLAARLSPAAAARNALIELCQMELGLQLASGKRDKLGEAALTDTDRRHLERAAVLATDLPPLAALEAPRRDASDVAANTAGQLAAVLAKNGAEAWYVDLTRPVGSLDVAKVIAPRLQPMPCDLVTERLSAVQKASGNVARPSVAIM